MNHGLLSLSLLSGDFRQHVNGEMRIHPRALLQGVTALADQLTHKAFVCQRLDFLSRGTYIMTEDSPHRSGKFHERPNAALLALTEAVIGEVNLLGFGALPWCTGPPAVCLTVNVGRNLLIPSIVQGCAQPCPSSELNIQGQMMSVTCRM